MDYRKEDINEERVDYETEDLLHFSSMMTWRGSLHQAIVEVNYPTVLFAAYRFYFLFIIQQ